MQALGASGRRPAQDRPRTGRDGGREVRRRVPHLRRDRAGDASAGVFGATIILLCGRPELELAAGRVDEGLRGYRDAFRVLQHRSLPSLADSVGYGPWIYYPQAAAVSAHVHHGATALAADLRDAAGEAPAPLRRQRVHRLPVVGSVLLSLALAGAGSPDPSAAERAPSGCSCSPTCSAATASCPAWPGGQRRAGRGEPGAVRIAAGRRPPRPRHSARCSSSRSWRSAVAAAGVEICPGRPANPMRDDEGSSSASNPSSRHRAASRLTGSRRARATSFLSRVACSVASPTPGARSSRPAGRHILRPGRSVHGAAVGTPPSRPRNEQHPSRRSP